jgi:hypothetical protein
LVIKRRNYHDHQFTNSPLSPKSNGLISPPETLGSSNVMGIPTAPPAPQNTQVAAGPLTPVIAAGIALAKKAITSLRKSKAAKDVAKVAKAAKDAKSKFDKTPIGKPLEESKHLRNRAKNIKNFVDQITAENDKDKERDKARQNDIARFGIPEFGDFGENGGFNGKDFAIPDVPSFGDFGDGHAAGSAPSTGSDAGMGHANDGMGLGSDTEGAGGWGFPVVLDLNNDGRLEIIPPTQSRAQFDILQTGRKQILAWVGPDDGLLVYDKDGDRLISHWDEIAFKEYLATAKTDLEGLAWFDQLAQGGNEDGVLDEKDALWSDFGVWRDADQDGETDPGELQMTGDGALASVNLTSDQTPRDAGPDAKIFGKGEYHFRNDQNELLSGDLYDTAFRYEELQQSKPTGIDLPTRSMKKGELPPLVRRDRQPLVLSEKMYPAMAYKENVYETWPDEAIEVATRKFPDLPQQIAESQQLPLDSPDDLLDPDYFQLPENPTFKDQFKHGVWRQKKYGKL